MEGRVIPEVMDYIILPQGRYPESFVLIYLLEVCQEGGSSKVLRYSDQRLGGQGTLDVMDNLILTQGNYPESVRLISLLEVCQEW